MKKRLFALCLMCLSTNAYAADPTIAPVTMTRADAVNAFNTLAAIGQPYKVTVKQGGQDVPVDKFLDVSAPMRSTLVHDLGVLKTVALETVKLQDDARQRLDPQVDARKQANQFDPDLAAYERELTTISQEKVNVSGLTMFTESDLQLDKNPQISLLQASTLSVLENK